MDERTKDKDAERNLGKRHALRANPNGVYIKAPWGKSAHHARTPTGFNTAVCATLRVGVIIVHVDPGCAARPRALLSDRVAVIRTLSTNPNGFLISKPRVAQHTLGQRRALRANPNGV
jgi:hypothetical protein